MKIAFCPQCNKADKVKFVETERWHRLYGCVRCMILFRIKISWFNEH